MLIDWFTVGAQIGNFLVLLVLLKLLLFDRIVRAMDDREQKIASRLQQAQQKQDEAERHSAELAEERSRFEAQRQQMLEEAGKEADQQRRRLMRKARDEVDRARQDWQRALEEQQEQFLAELSERAGRALERAVRQALADLADADVQERMVRTFLGRLEQMDPQQRKTFGKAIDEADGRVVVASAGELAEDVRRKITDALKRGFHDGVQAVFETSPELISGLEVRSHGRALGWSLSRYLDEFEETLGAALREQAETLRQPT